MTKIHDHTQTHFQGSGIRNRDEHRAAQVRKLLSQIPWYALQARQRLETGGHEGEMGYWLALYNELNHEMVDPPPQKNQGQ